MEKLEDQRIKGLAYDIMMASINLQVFGRIKSEIENGNLSASVNSNHLFSYLRRVSIDSSILYLGRIFDKKNSQYETRCLKELLNIISDQTINDSIITQKKWKDFKEEFSDVLNVIYNEDEKKEPDGYINSVKRYLNQNNNAENPIEKLKFWRDKYSSHNENNEAEPSLSIDEANLLLNIAKSVHKFINEFISTGSYISVDDKNVFFMDELIEKYSG